MATGGTFVITELLLDGAVVPGGAARFEWTADLRSAPKKPWTIGTAVRNKRTDYPGGDEPTHQVLGPNSKDQALQGEWDDRFNGAGYARATRKAFDDMVRRCNPVRLEFNGLAFVGLITDADYPYDYDGKIGYHFSFSPQVAEEAAPLRDSATAARVVSASALLDSMNGLMDDLSTIREGAPTAALAGTTASDLDALLDDVEGAFANIDDVLNQRLVQPIDDAKIDILRIGQLFGSMRNSVATVLDSLAELRSDTDLAYQTAADVLDFDAWARELGSTLRLLSMGATDAGDEVAKRAQADVRALYRPHQGEHLYSISRKFYGTTAQWRMLAERNGLVSPTMTGDELLVIPSSGSVGDRDGIGANVAGGGTAGPAEGGTGADSGGTTADGAGGLSLF